MQYAKTASDQKLEAENDPTALYTYSDVSLIQTFQLAEPPLVPAFPTVLVLLLNQLFFVCLFVCFLFVGWFVCLFLFVCLFVFLFVCWFVCLLVCLLVCFFCLFVCFSLILVFCSGVGDLSVLARGRGLVGGGVEIECFADDRKAFTLTVSVQRALVEVKISVSEIDNFKVAGRRPD